MKQSIQLYRLLRLPEVKRIFGYRSDASIYTAVKELLCTTGVLISQRSRGWPEHEIQLLAAARIAGKTDTEIRELVQSLHTKRQTAFEALEVSQ